MNNKIVIGVIIGIVAALVLGIIMYAFVISPISPFRTQAGAGLNGQIEVSGTVHVTSTGKITFGLAMAKMTGASYQ